MAGHSGAKRISVVAAGLLAALAVPAFAGSTDARALIGHMNEALGRRNYDGVFVQQIGARRETWRIIHRMRDGRMTERLISTDGSGREFVRNGPEAVWYFPDRKVVLVEQRGRASGYITALYGVGADTEKYYQLRSSEQPVRVRGFMARLVTVEPRDALRYGYRYWIDEKTSMPVRTQLVAATGEVIAEISFISMGLPDAINEELLKPDVDTTGFRWMRRDNPGAANSVRTAFIARQELLPPGFSVKNFPNLPAMPATPERGPRTRFIISDGLAWVSVFIEDASAGEQPGAMRRSEGLVQMGTTAAFSLTTAGYRITVVGDVPAETVRAIASAIQPE
jgi:sigma-E factor negative regulatory protein RseB